MSLYRFFDAPSKLSPEQRTRLRDLWLREGSLTAAEYSEMQRLEAKLRSVIRREVTS